MGAALTAVAANHMVAACASGAMAKLATVAGE